MKTNRILVALFAALTLTPGAVLAHGITVTLERHGDVVVVLSRYDGGIPVRGADVVVRAPGVDTPFQTGRTDPEGRFVFMPGAAGEWQVSVDDGMGHRRTARIEWAEAGTLPAPDEDRDDDVVTEPAQEATSDAVVRAGADDGTTTWRLLTGLSLLVGITGFGYGYSARARGRTAP